MYEEVEKLSQKELRLYEKLLMVFPGYRGYKEKELIRETDRVVRDELLRRLRRSLEDLRRLYSALVSRGGLSGDAKRVESMIYRLDSLAEKTRHAPYGYRPLFHVVKVDEEKLTRMLEHDLTLADVISALNSLTSKLLAPDTTPECLSSLLNDVEGKISEYEVKLSEREGVLAGFMR
ncbi:MAG: hypothetical protein QXX81_06885 [Zestosphaera sp.]